MKATVSTNPPWPNFFFVLNGLQSGNTATPAIDRSGALGNLADGWWFIHSNDEGVYPPQGPFFSKDDAAEAARPISFMGTWWVPVHDLEAEHVGLPAKNNWKNAGGWYLNRTEMIVTDGTVTFRLKAMPPK